MNKHIASRLVKQGFRYCTLCETFKKFSRIHKGVFSKFIRSTVETKNVTNTVYRLIVSLTVSVPFCAPFRSSVLPFRVHFSSCDRLFMAL